MPASVLKPLVFIIGDNTNLVTTLNLLLVMVGYETTLPQSQVQAISETQWRKPTLVVLALIDFNRAWRLFCDQINRDQYLQRIPICAVVQARGAQTPSAFYQHTNGLMPEPFELTTVVHSLDTLIVGAEGRPLLVSQQAQAYRKRITNEYMREVNA